MVDTKVGTQVPFWYGIPSLKSILKSIDRADKGVTITKTVSNTYGSKNFKTRPPILLRREHIVQIDSIAYGIGPQSKADNIWPTAHNMQ